MKKILIIGGSRGIGRSIVEKLDNTNQVVNISRTKPEDFPRNIEHYSLDVLVDELPDLDKIDALIYCPGNINLKPISRLSETDFKNDFDINVIGAVRVIQKYLNALKLGSDPSVLLFSSVAVKLGMPFHASTAVSKAGVEALIRSLGAELAPLIRFNALAPTVTNTDLASKLLRNETMKEKMRDRHPLKTYLQPEEVADMAEFLISGKGRSISGQVITLDCGIVSFKL